MGSHTALGGKGPERFAVGGNTAIIDAREDEVQAIINYFKGWLPRVNQVYEARIRREQREAEEKARRELEQESREQEARLRVLRDVQI